MLDVLAIVAAVVIVALVSLFPFVTKAKPKAKRINCVNNVKQIGLSFRLWAGDNNDKYPMQVSTNLGGSMELITGGSVYPHFKVMSNELSTPKLLSCPDDSQRTRATYFDSTLNDSNISYFAVPEADETLPQMWLAGDRNLTANNTALKPGLFTIKVNQIMGWSAQQHKLQGNIGFADGSVQQITTKRLHESATNALHPYFAATTNTSFRIAIP
jgi:prepilin-type processing-associated H-X9-DG protein